MRNYLALLFVSIFMCACGGGGGGGGNPSGLSIPTVTITAPVTNNLARKTITVTGTVISPHTPTKVELLVNGTSVANAASLTAPSIALDTTAYPDGPHSVVLRVSDMGLVTTSSAVVIKVDNTPPTSTIVTSWQPAYYIPCGSFLFPRSCYVPAVLLAVNGVATDAYSGAASVGVVGGVPVIPAADGSWSIPPPAAGSTIRVTDTAGNCTDYTDSANSYTWTTVVSGACP